MTLCVNALLRGAARCESGIWRKRKFVIGLCFSQSVFKKCLPGWEEILKDPDKRAILSWLGGGAVVVAGGIWTVVTFVVEHKDTPDKKGGTTITVGQGIASAGDTHINGPVTFGPSKEQIEQIQKPLADQLAEKDAQIAL